MFDFEHFRAEYRKLHFELHALRKSVVDDRDALYYVDQAMSMSRQLVGHLHMLDFHLEKSGQVEENKEQNTSFKGQEGS